MQSSMANHLSWEQIRANTWRTGHTHEHTHKISLWVQFYIGTICRRHRHRRNLPRCTCGASIYTV